MIFIIVKNYKQKIINDINRKNKIYDIFVFSDAIEFSHSEIIFLINIVLFNNIGILFKLDFYHDILLYIKWKFGNILFNF